jgi:PKD domain-containing protein
MNKKILGILVVMLLIATAVLPIVSSSKIANVSMVEVKDQYQETNDDCFWLSSAVSIWQEFVPTYNKLVRVEIMAMQGYGDSPPLAMEIHQPLGHLLSYKEVPVALIPNSPGWVSFDISDINVNPGNKYYIMVYYTGAGEYACCGAYGNKYIQGDSDRGGGWDWCFRTFAEAENSAPSTPSINGPNSGKAGENHEYKFQSTDPEGDNVFYCIDWGDGTGEVCIGPFASGIQATASHTWSSQGDYTIRAKAKDIHDAESDWATLEVTMPKNKQYMPLGIILAFGFDVDVKIVQLEPGEDYVDLEVLSKPFYIWENEIQTINSGAFIRLYFAKGFFSPSVPICFGICEDWSLIG